MLALPDRGMQLSVNKHNISLNVLCDWIEASVVFDEKQLAKSDVIDILMEEEIYIEQDFASEIVENAWTVISNRMDYLSNPLEISVVGNRINRILDWAEFPAYGFCLALSCVDLYSQLPKIWGNGYVTQGSLFEELALESFTQTFQGWTVKRIGWSSTNNPISLRDALPTVLDALNENSATDTKLHLNESVKDMGLDLLAFYSFEDRQASMPVILVQCASGKNWKTKRHTPDIDLWKKIINFSAQPIRAFAIPFAFTDALQFKREAAPVNGVFVDRYRLLKAFRQKNSSVSDVMIALGKQIEGWLNPLIAKLPRANQ